MNKQLEINELMRKELARCYRLKKQLEKRKAFFPKGSLSKKENRFYVYIREKGKAYSIHIKNDDKLIQELKEKRYVNAALPELQKHICACEEYLKSNVLYDPKGIECKLPESYSGLNGLDIFLEGDLNIDEWDAKNYKKNTMKFIDQHYTAGNIQCRSKSEAMIGTCIEQRGLSYRYEPEIKINGRFVCPDFAILLPNRRKIVYWEHFGMINNSEYAYDSLKK